MRQIKTRILWRRVMAFILCLCMVSSLISGVGLFRAVVARAAGGTSVSAGGPTSGATRQADPSTMDTYQQMLDFSENTRYAGRLWSDKSVFALGYGDTGDRIGQWNKDTGTLTLTKALDGVDGTIGINEDFLHVFSALGSSLKLDDSIKGPYDVVILLDMSGSMLSVVDENQPDRISKSRIGVVLDSINEAINKLMDMHATNRVAVIGYGATAYTLMELGHYKPCEGADTYLTAENLSGYNDNTYKAKPDEFTGTSGAYTVHVKAKKEETLGNESTYQDYEKKARNNYQANGTTGTTLIGFHTDLQAGIWQGFNELYKNLDPDKPETYSYTYKSKLTGEETQIPRVPVAFVMTDGGSNYALKETNAPDGGNGDEWYNVPIATDVTNGSYGGNIKKYQAEINDTDGKHGGEAVILDILMTASYMKSKIINKYKNELLNKIKDSPENAARMAAWDFSIHSISVDTPTSDREIPRVYAALDPKDFFNTETVLEEGVTVGGKLFKPLTDWKQGKDIVAAYNKFVEWKSSTTKAVEIESTYSDGSKKVKFNQLSGSESEVKKQDITSNIIYNDSFADITAGGLSKHFEELIGQLGQELFSPVGGENDLGVDDAVTYMDPIGKYMDVKDVTNLSLFGELYNIVKTAVYDYQWNHQYMVNEEKGSEALPGGWYKGDPVPGDKNNTHVQKYDENGGYYPDGCTTIEQAWEKGWVYRVNYKTAAQYVPTLENINTSEEPDTAKQQNTVYTFYRIAGTSDGDPMTDDYLTKLHMNPAYGDTVPASAGTYNAETQEHLKTPGVYALIDIRIWTEDSGDYSVTDTGDTLTDNNYDEALWVNIPVNMLPLRRVTVKAGDGIDDITYSTNIPANTNELTAAQTASFPLRLFYTVGVSDEVLEASNRVNIAGAISAEYIKENKVTSQAAETVRNVPQGNLEFFSNWYNPLNRYSDYATTSIDYTYGDPVVSFSPSKDNRYYAFEKALPLYSAAYRYSDDGTTQKWERVKIEGDKLTAEETGSFYETSATGFGGRLIAQDLEGDAENIAENLKTKLEKEAQEKNEPTVTLKDGDIVFLKKDRLTDVTVEGDNDPFPSDGYYFLAIEFFNLTANPTENTDGNAARTQYAITRKGSEFGSAYGAANIKNGDMLVWHDMSGTHEDQPYKSFSETGKSDRGKPTTPGEWVVAAKKGGLRVGDLAQNVQGKGGDYASIDEGTMKAFSDERYPGNHDADGLNWGYYAQNVTRTANNYYMPTISTASSLGENNDIIVNVYLGNNGRLYVSDTTLLVTKTVEPAEGMTFDKNKEFNFQVFIANADKKMDVIVVHWNDKTNSWQRQFHTIDLELDGQLFLQTPDGAKAMVDENGKQVVTDGSADSGYKYADGSDFSGGTVYYVYIGKNRNTTEAVVTSTGFRVYHNNEVDGNGTVNEADVTSETDQDDKTTYKAAKVWLVSVSKYAQWNGKDPIGDTNFNLSGDLYDKELTDFALLTLDPTVAGTEVAVSSPYRTASAYWTKEITFGVNSNPDGDKKDTNHDPLVAGDLYDQIIPVADRPDYFAGLTNEKIAQNTAEFTLKDGEGLLFSGISSNSVYRVTEKLTKEDMEAGYTLKQVSHNQQVGSTSTYQPGVQSIPVYYHDGATYGEIYPSGTAYMPEAYRSNNTQYGLTWAVKQGGSKNEEGYLHYEPFFNTNAVVVEAYSTFAPDAAGDNHHQPTAVTDGTSVFWLWHSDTNQNTNEGGTYTVLDNPSCTALNHENLAEGGCDDTLADGQIRHYFFKDGVLLDQHYYGEGSGYLRDFARFVTSPTVHFAVKDENPQDNRNPADYNFTSSTDYTGAYSVFGNTGTYEESANFVNTVEPGTLSVTKELAPKDKLTQEDLDREFDFTLKLTDPEPPTGIKGPVTGYPYTITDESGEVKSGRLIPSTATPSDNDIKAEEEDGTWKFQLKGGQTLTAEKIPGKTEYTVTEAEAKGFKTDVQVNGGEATTTSTANGTVTPGAANQTKILFTNIKDKPALLSLVKKLTVKLYGGAQFKWRFEFTVTPGKDNDPNSDPIRKRDDFDETTGKLTLTMDFNVSTDGEHSQKLTIFDNDAFTQEGTYTYTIKETDKAIPGMKYDDRVYEVKVEVTKGDVDTEGRIQLVATLTINGQPANKVTFANDYDVARIVQTFNVQKELKDSAGNPLTPAAGEFSFTLTAKDYKYADGDQETGTSSPMPKGVTDSPYTVPNAAGGKVLFGEVEFTRPGTYNYTIQEDVPQGAPSGYDYDKTVYNVTVVVERQSDGSLGTTVTYQKNGTTGTSNDGITFTNTVDLGGLTVSKTVTGIGNKDKEFHFTVTFTPAVGLERAVITKNGNPLEDKITEGKLEFDLKHGEFVEITGLPAGTKYQVTEDNYTGEGYTTSSSNASGTIPPNSTANATFVNDRQESREPGEGNLKVSKTVTGEGDTNKDFSFTVTLSGTSVDGINGEEINGQYGDIHFTDGVATFTLKHNQSVVATGLPAGITYVVKENDYTEEGYDTSEHGEPEGIIPDGGTAEASYVNDFGKVLEPKDRALQVTKTVLGDAGDLTKEWHFTVTLFKDGTVDTSVTGIYGNMTFTNGVAEFTLKSGEKALAESLPEGDTYEVVEKEANHDGYTTTVSGDTGTITENGTANADFINHKDPPPEKNTGNLTVTKTVTGNGGNKTKYFNFHVELSDKTVTGTFGNMTFRNGIADFTLKNGESLTANGLPAGITYTVTETEANQDGYHTTSAGDRGTIPDGGTARADFVNSKSDEPGPEKGNLTVTKLVSGTAGDTGKEWHFTVTLSDTSISGTYGEMTFKDGVAEFTLKHGQSKTATELPANVTYTVMETEANADGYDTTSTGASGTIPENGTANADFVNSKDAPGPEFGGLTVSKTVTAGDTVKDWHFTVILSDTSVNGIYGGMFFTNGVAEFTLKHGQSLTAEGLPTGITYTVTEFEANKDSYTTTSTGESGTIPTDGKAEAKFVNRKNTTTETGGLTVTKTVTGTAGDKSKEWHFRVELSDKSVSGTYGGMTFTDGVAAFKLKHGESLTATNLPAGITYTVTETEANQDGYITTPSGESGTIPENDTARAESTNYKDDHTKEPKSGNLTVTKTVTAGDLEKEWHFTVALSDTTISGTYGEMTFTSGVATFTLKSGDTITATGLPVGITYTVTEKEANQDGYTTTSTGSGGTIEEGKTSRAEFFNRNDTTTTTETGDLTVTKTVTGTAGDTAKAWHFTVELSNKDITGTYDEMEFTNGVAEFTLKSGESKTANGLPAGITYTVTEAEAHQDGYTTGSTGFAGTIPADGTTEAKFTNSKGDTTTPKTGDLTVSKTVTGTGDTGKEWNFRVELSDKTVNGTYGGMSFTNGVATFKLKDGESLTATGLPVGIAYTVTETEANQDGYHTAPAGDEGTIPDGGTAQANFVNNKNTETEPGKGNLTVTKLVSGTAGDRDKAFTFTVELSDRTISATYGDMDFTNGVATFTLKHSESATAKDLPAGLTYTVTETNADGHTVTYTGETGEIPDSGTAYADFENHKDAPEPEFGGLTVSKTVTGNAGDHTKAWHFTVELSNKTVNGIYGGMFFTNGVAEFTLKSGDSLTAEGLPAGITYTVTEFEANKDGYTTTSTNASGAIPENGTANVEFVNTTTTPKTGNLTVSKTVTGAEGDKSKEWHFRVELSDKSINGTYGGMTFTDGVAEVTLKHGQSKTAENLPAGITYTVTEREAHQDGYTTGSTGAVGTIPADDTAEARFTNSKGDTTTTHTGDLTVSKTVTGTAGDKNKNWNFRVELSDKSVNGDFGKMTFRNGVAEFTLKSGESLTATGLPAGITYTVTEKEANEDGYTTGSTGFAGTIPANGKAEAEFTNHKGDTTTPKTGGLTVSKTVVGTAGDTSKEWHFRVELSDRTVNGTYGGMTFTDGVANFDLKHGESLTATGLPAGITYTVTEEEANADGYHTTIAGDKGTIPDGGTARADFVNSKSNGPGPKLGNLTVTKLVSGTAGDTNKEWHFTVTLSDETISGTYGEMTFTNGVANFTLKHKQSVTATGLPAGITYTVTETEANKDGYHTTSTGASGAIPKNDTANADFVNSKDDTTTTPKTGSLTISKTVTGGEVADGEVKFHFTVTLTGAAADGTPAADINGKYGDMFFVNGVAQFDLSNRERKTASDLPAGLDYTVTETTTADFTPILPEGGSTEGIIPGNGTARADFVNRKDTVTRKEPGPGSLTVIKTVTGDAGELNKEFHFTVTLSDTTISGAYGGMTFTNGVATFTLKSGESVTAEGLPDSVGYKVTETEANKDGYTTEMTGDRGTISEDTAVWANFINHKDPPPEELEGNLVVTKTVEGDAGDINKEFHFTVTLSDTSITGTYGGMTFRNGVAEFTLKHGQSKTAKGLPAGLEYTVTETEANKDGYYTQVTGDKGTIPDGDTARADFVNSKNTKPEPGTGNLTVTKTVSGNAGEAGREWHFSVTLSDKTVNGTYGDMFFVNGVAEFTLKHGDSLTAKGLSAGVSYTVTETEANEDGYTTSITGDKGIIPDGGTARADFVNSKNTEPKPGTGNLTVTKTVSGNSGEMDREWHFTVTLSDRTVNGTYGNMFFVNGVAEFTLKNGESLTAMGLPAGVTYTVTEAEANEDGYTTGTSGETGAIPNGGTARALFINSRDETPPTEPDDTTPEPDDTTPGPDDTTPEPDNPPDTPKTGDDSHLGLWAMLMVLSLAGVTVTSFSLFGRRSFAGSGKWRVASFKGKHRGK